MEIESNVTGYAILDEYIQGPIFENMEDLHDRIKIEEAVQRVVHNFISKMPEIWKKLPLDYQKKIIKIAGCGWRDIYRVAAEYLVQEKIFIELGNYYHLKEGECFNPASHQGVMALSENNSMVTATPPDETGIRDVEYVRISSRKKSLGEALSFKEKGPTISSIGASAYMAEGRLKTYPIRSILIIPGNTDKRLVNEINDNFSRALISVLS